MNEPSEILVYDFKLQNLLIKINFDYDIRKPIVVIQEKYILLFIN